MSQTRILKKTSSHSQIGTIGGDDYSAIPKIKSNNNAFQRQMSQDIDGTRFGKQMGKKQQTLSASLSVGLNNKLGGGITTAQSLFGPKNQSSSILVGSKPLFQNIKQRKNDEGYDGLPEDYEPIDEKNFEEADSCFLCFKKLAKKFGGLRKKGRHHCRKCGRTVCDRCR